jgi:hypothetical protein
VKPVFGAISFAMPFVGAFGAAVGRTLEAPVGGLVILLFMWGTPLIGLASGVFACVRRERYEALAATGITLSTLWAVFVLSLFLG